MAEEKALESPDPYFEPLVTLPPVQTKTLEEDETELIKLRAKLYRYDTEEEPPEWKERGTGDVKILQHKAQDTCRILMRRDKTHKICANHYVLPHMELKPNCGSDRAWVWSTLADFADEESKTELLAIRFSNAENAQKFKAKFDEAKAIMEECLKHKPEKELATCDAETEKESIKSKKEAGGEGQQAAAAAANEETDHVIDKLNELQVGDSSAAAAAPAAVTESVTDKEHKNKKETESTVSEEGEGTK